MLGFVSWYCRAIHGPRSLEAPRGNAKGFHATPTSHPCSVSSVGTAGPSIAPSAWLREETPRVSSLRLPRFHARFRQLVLRPSMAISARLLRAVALHLSPTQHSGQGARALRAGVAGQRSHGWRSAGSVERAKAWRAAASARRQSMGTMTHTRPRRSFLKKTQKTTVI